MMNTKTKTLYRATHKGDPCGIGSHWCNDLDSARFWQTAGCGCGGPRIVTCLLTGSIIDAEDMSDLISETMPDDAWEPDWIADHLWKLPPEIEAVETMDDQGMTAYVLARSPQGLQDSQQEG